MDTTTTFDPLHLDSGTMSPLLPVILIALLALLGYCAYKESAVTGKYLSYGVYGRFKGYLFTDLLLAGLAYVFFAVVAPTSTSLSEALTNLAIGIICLVVAAVIFLLTYAKCPSGMRGKLIPSMLITGMGISMKFCLFFISNIWDYIGPEELVDEYGNHVYAFADGDVYDGAGNKVGKRTGMSTYRRYR